MGLRQHKLSVVIADNATVSGPFSAQEWSIFYMALFPDMVAGDVTMEFSIDNGSNYHPILDIGDGADATLVTSGSDPGWVDFSDLIRAVPSNSEYLLRFVSASSQTGGPLTVVILMRG